MSGRSALLLSLLAAAPLQDAPIAPAPKVEVPPATRTRSPVASVLVADADQYRNGQAADVTRASQLFELDLSRVDLDADPILVVEGQPISRADLERHLGLMLGSTEIEQFITGVILRRAKKQLADAGREVPAVQVSEEDVAAKFEQDKTVMAQMRGVAPEEYERQIKEVFGWDNYVEFQKQQLEFERFFLPDPPAEWAQRQQAEAKRLDEEQKARREREAKEAAENAAAAGQPPPPAAAPEPPPIPEADLAFVPEITWELLDPRFVQPIRDNYARGHSLHPLMRGGMIQGLRKKLLEGVEVRVAPAGDPVAVLYCAGEPFALRDLLALLSPRLDGSVRRIALRELVNLRAADVRLAREGAALGEAEADAAMAEFRKKYDGTLIPFEHAVRAFGFNSPWHYREFFRRKHAYERKVAAAMPDEKLALHYDGAGRIFFENGTCIAQVLFIPGADRAAGKQRIDELMRSVAAGTPFPVLAREHGAWPEGGDVHGGAIAPAIRTKLRTALRESEYTAFLTGHSLADEAFYAAVEGSILGPVWLDLDPGHTGWVALHVERFFTTGSRSPFSDPKMKERALDDLIDVTFPRYVNEALASCRIELPPARPN